MCEKVRIWTYFVVCVIKFEAQVTRSPLPAGYVKSNVMSRSLAAKLSASLVPRLSYWHQLQLGRLRRANVGPFPAFLLPHLLCPLGCQAPLSLCLLYLFASTPFSCHCACSVSCSHYSNSGERQKSGSCLLAFSHSSSEAA